MVYFFDVPHIKDAARKARTALGVPLSSALNAAAKDRGYNSWEVLLKHVVGPGNPAAFEELFKRRHVLLDEAEGLEDFVDEVFPETFFHNSQYAGTPTMTTAIDQLDDQRPWYHRDAIRIAKWFCDNHVRAVDRSPYNGRAGGYLYPTVDVFDVLETTFLDVDHAIIEQMAERLDGEDAWIEASFINALEEDWDAESTEINVGEPLIVPVQPGNLLGEGLSQAALDDINENLGSKDFFGGPDDPFADLHQAFVDKVIDPVKQANEIVSQARAKGQMK